MSVSARGSELILRKNAVLGKRVAVLMASNYTGTGSDLAGCENDVDFFQNLLQTRFGFTDFVILKGSSGQAHLVPSRANILRTLTDVAERTKKGGVDTVVIQFSGHGTYVPDSPGGDEDDGRDEAIVPQDMHNLIVDDELRRILNSFSPWCRVFGLVDACHSGTVFDLPLLWGANNAACVLRTNETAPVCDIILISGCRDEQTSADTADGKTGRAGGAMTIAFGECMFSSPNVFALVENMTANLTAKGFAQRPQLTSSRPINPDDALSRWLR